MNINKELVNQKENMEINNNFFCTLCKILININYKPIFHFIIVFSFLFFIKPIMFGVFLSLGYFGFITFVYIEIKKEIPDEFVYLSLIYMFLISGIE